MQQIVDFSVFIIDIIVLPLICAAVFERRVKPWFFWIGCIILGLAWYWVLIILPQSGIWFKLPINLLWSYIIISFYKGPLLHRASVALIYMIIHAGIDVFLYGIAVSISHSTMQEILDNVNLSAFYAVLGHIILFAFCFFLARVLGNYKHNIHMSLWEWLPILLVISFNAIELHFTMNALSDSNSHFSFFPIQAVMLLFVNVALLLLLDRLSSQHRLTQENHTLQEQMRFNLLNLQAATESYETQRSLTHDFDNRLLTIAELLQAGRQEDALSYAQAVRGRVAETDVAVSTNNPIADAVLNQKYRRAREKHIDIQFLVNDLSCFPLSADEMVTVLSNLLDNAIDACERQKAEGNQRASIRVKLLMESSQATLSVQNTSLPITLSQKGLAATSKKNKLEHGFGMKNCQKILRGSGFDYAIQYKDGQFQFTAMKAG